MKPIHILAVVFAVSNLAVAGEWHLTPGGAGKRDGTSWEHAFDQAALGRAVNEVMRPGDRLLLGGGTYRRATLTVAQGGSRGQPKMIVGVDRGAGLPLWLGEWSVDSPTKGATAIRIEPGVSYVVFQRLRIKGYVFCVHAPPPPAAAPCVQLVFDDVDMEQFRHGFYLADCDDLRLEGCDLKHYSKHAFRFDRGCDRVTVRQCAADCSEGDAEWEMKTEALPFGFVVTDGGAPNTALRFEDCLARNNLMPLSKKKYKNGDGFVVEGNSADVKFVRCRAIRNQDGGFDLKVRDVQLTGCVAVGNSRNFRVWTTGTLVNCFAGWGTTGLWCNGGPLTVNRCTFHACSGAAVMTDDHAAEPVTLSDCLISGSEKPYRKTARGEVVLKGTVVADGKAEENAPGYVRPDPAWDGRGDAMDSRTYPDKGYCVRAEVGR